METETKRPLPLDCTFQVGPESDGTRLDHYLVRQLDNHTRSEITRLIKSGAIEVNGQTVKPGHRLRPGDNILVFLPAPLPEAIQPREIPFSILYEDQSVLVIDKPAGLVVHPAEGHRQDTLVNGLLFRYPDLPGEDPARPGIVHRLDKDTSGVLVVAKNNNSLQRLSRAFRERQVRKTYLAVLLRKPAQDQGRLVAPIGRHPVHRKKMSVRESGGRYAATTWSIKKAWPGYSFAEIGIETGRTHQIRVHMASLGAPVAGDDLYGGRVNEIDGVRVTRQLLHASTLCFPHPDSGVTLSCTAPLPPDMDAVLMRLDRKDEEFQR